MNPRTLPVLVIDSNTFSRGLIGEILRNLDVSNISSARSEDMADAFLRERPADVILLSWEEGDALDGLSFVRKLRRMDDNRLRRLPLVLITAGLTRQMVINGRDSGVDEFLAKPISPIAMRQRLEMVVETPRPFVDSSVYLGPCRRRKNPADYYGAKRRAGERLAERPSLIDHDEVAAQTPIRLVLTELRETCIQLRERRPEAMVAAFEQLKAAKGIAIALQDHALHAGLASFESYVATAAPLGQLEEPATTTALTALEQLAALPQSFAQARDSVATTLDKAIQKKLAA